MHFEFSYLHIVRQWSSLVVLHVSVQFSQHHLLQILSLPTFYIFGLFVVGERNGKPLQYSCLENPMSSMKSKKI